MDARGVGGADGAALPSGVIGTARSDLPVIIIIGVVSIRAMGPEVARRQSSAHTVRCRAYLRETGRETLHAEPAMEWPAPLPGRNEGVVSIISVRRERSGMRYCYGLFSVK